MRLCIHPPFEAERDSQSNIFSFEALMSALTTLASGWTPIDQLIAPVTALDAASRWSTTSTAARQVETTLYVYRRYPARPASKVKNQKAALGHQRAFGVYRGACPSAKAPLIRRITPTV